MIYSELLINPNNTTLDDGTRVFLLYLLFIYSEILNAPVVD